MGDATVKQIDKFIAATLDLTIATQYLRVTTQLLHQVRCCTKRSKDQDQSDMYSIDLEIELLAIYLLPHQIKQLPHNI